MLAHPSSLYFLLCGEGSKSLPPPFVGEGREWGVFRANPTPVHKQPYGLPQIESLPLPPMDAKRLRKLGNWPLQNSVWFTRTYCHARPVFSLMHSHQSRIARSE